MIIDLDSLTEQQKADLEVCLNDFLQGMTFKLRDSKIEAAIILYSNLQILVKEQN